MTSIGSPPSPTTIGKRLLDSTDLNASYRGELPARLLGEAELAALYRQFHRAIFRLCLRILSDRAEAEDVAQTAFMRMHQHMERVGSSRQTFAWLRRTATNLCLNEIRARNAHPTVDVSDEIRDHAPMVDCMLSDHDQVWKMTRRIPIDLTVTAWLYYGRNLEQKEIAHRLGVTRRTVIARLQRFMQLARVPAEHDHG